MCCRGHAIEFKIPLGVICVPHLRVDAGDSSAPVSKVGFTLSARPSTRLPSPERFSRGGSPGSEVGSPWDNSSPAA